MRSLVVRLLVSTASLSLAFSAYAHDRALQQTGNNFAVQYVGQFASVQSPLCTGPTPVLRAYCNGGAITIDSTSDPSITCAPLAQPVDGLDGVECTTSCTGTACNSVYLNPSIATGVFGEVTFTCTGASSTTVDGIWSWVDSGDGNCQASLSDSGFNVNLARLGVQCPGTIGPILDDFYSDCVVALPLDSTPGDEYTCFDGDICQGAACVVDYQGIDIYSQSENFMDGCIMALTGLPITPAPTPGGAIVGGVEVSALFATEWGVLVAEGEEGLPSSSCAGGERNLRITCGTPTGRITFVNASDTSIVCTPVGTNVLECSDSSSDRNVFQTLVYQCASGTVPSTTVEYLPATASCSGNTNPALVTHAVRLGPNCGSLGFLYIDVYTECGPDNQFQSLDGNFTCSSSVAFPALSSTGVSIPLVLMSTDALWSDNPDESCITVAASAPSTPDAPTAPSAPTTGIAPKEPTAPGTTAPIAPRSAPTTPTGFVPTTKPVVPPVTTSPSPTNSAPTVDVSPPSPPSPSGSAPVVDSSNILYQPPVNIAPIPIVEDGFLYSASYVGQFQYIRDEPCYGPTNPDIRVYCVGEVKLTGRSDKRIACNEILPDSEAYLDSFSGVQCTTNCTDDDTECTEIFLNQDNKFGGPPFGQVYFQCSGNTLPEITPFFIYADNGLDEYGCNFAANDTGTRNYHIARMGVSCPSETGTGQEYVFDDYYFDCLAGSADTFYAETPSDFIICFAGDNCLGKDCDIEMGAAAVNAQTQNFQDRCVASLVDITTTPTQAPLNSTTETALVSSALFQARWGVQMDSEESNSTIFDCYAGGPQIIRIYCPNSEIELVNETFPETTLCTTTVPGVLECVDTGDSYLTVFTSLTYRCTGATLPTTSMEYPSTVAYCEDNNVAVRVRHAAQVGVYCSDYADFIFAHLFVECDGLSEVIDTRDIFGSNYSAFTCIQFVEFAVGSSSDANQTIPSLSIGTDEGWLGTDEDSCFTLGRPDKGIVTVAPTSAPSTLAPIDPPTLSPTTAMPSDTPSALPSSVPTTGPSATPVLQIVPTTPAAADRGTSAAPTTVKRHGASALVWTGSLVALWLMSL